MGFLVMVLTGLRPDDGRAMFNRFFVVGLGDGRPRETKCILDDANVPIM